MHNNITDQQNLGYHNTVGIDVKQTSNPIDYQMQMILIAQYIKIYYNSYTLQNRMHYIDEVSYTNNLYLSYSSQYISNELYTSKRMYDFFYLTKMISLPRSKVILTSRRHCVTCACPRRVSGWLPEVATALATILICTRRSRSFSCKACSENSNGRQYTYRKNIFICQVD